MSSRPTGACWCRFAVSDRGRPNESETWSPDATGREIDYDYWVTCAFEMLGSRGWASSPASRLCVADRVHRPMLSRPKNCDMDCAVTILNDNVSCTLLGAHRYL